MLAGVEALHHVALAICLQQFQLSGLAKAQVAGSKMKISLCRTLVSEGTLAVPKSVP